MTLGEVADFAAAASAIFAALALRYNAVTFSQQSKSSDIATYFEIFEQICKSEYNLCYADEDKREHFINEHFNRLEAIAHLYNKDTFGKATKELCKDSLINHLAAFKLQDDMLSRLNKSVTANDTYEQLIIFFTQNKDEIKIRHEGFVERQNQLTQP